MLIEKYKKINLLTDKILKEGDDPPQQICVSALILALALGVKLMHLEEKSIFPTVF